MDERFWFPAKRYGWGWGFPHTWQGRTVLTAFVGLIVAGTVVVPPSRSLAGYLVYQTCLTLVLIGIVWLKGEPPRWRWGDRDGPDR